MKTHSIVVVPQQLPLAGRDRLAHALYAVHRQIFAGVDFATFTRHVVDSPAGHTAILLHLDAGEALVGYCALHLFTAEPRADVVRLEAGLLRDYRGAGRNVLFVLRRLIWHRLRHPRSTLWFLSTPVHPASYLAMVRLAGAVWPGHERPTPAAVAALGETLRRHFGLRPVPAGDAGLIDVGWITRESGDESARWRANPHPAVRFFLRRNPDYGAGHGLLTLIPVTLAAVARAVWRFARRRRARRGGGAEQGFTPPDADR